MKSETYYTQLIQAVTASQKGVLTLRDLESLLQTYDSTILYRRIRRLEELKVLKRFSKGIYVVPGQFNLRQVSQRLSPDSYISAATVLADQALIGTIPKNTVYAVKLGKKRIYRSKLGTIVQFGFTAASAHLMTFGSRYRDGIRYADQEKAFLDTLYFYQRGYRFSFNVYSDLNAALLDRAKIDQYLTHYKNKKFIAFVKGVLSA